MAKKSIKSNYAFTALYYLSNIIIPIITTPYLTRVLHAAGVGEYSFYYSVSYYFYIFVRLGLHNYGNRSIASVKDDKEELDKTFWEIYFFQLFMGILVAIIYIGYCIFGADNKTLAFIFLLLVLSGSVDWNWALYGLEEFKLTSIRDIMIKLLTALCIFAFVKGKEDVWKYSLIYCLGFFVSQIISIPVVLKRVSFVLPTFKGIISHIKPNLVLFIPTIAVSIYKTMDKVMLGIISSQNELGYYHSSENIIRVPLALISALGTVMLPRMTNLLSNNENSNNIENIFDKSIMFSMFITTSICMGIMTVSREFVPLFFGQGFEKCIILFYIVLPSCIFLAFADVIRTQFLLPRKKDRLFIISLFVGAGVNLVMNMIFIPQFASIGAAIGTLTAECIVCVVQSVAVFKDANIGRNVINSMPFLISGCVMFVVFRNFSVNCPNLIIALLLKIFVSGSLYLSVLGAILLIRHIIKRNGKKTA